MSRWAARVQKQASTFGNVVASCANVVYSHPQRLDKVKFGVPLEEVCKDDIPGPLLVLILKLNKEAPCRKNPFRATGHLAAMKRMIDFLQSGRLVNIDNFAVNTLASVLKNFLGSIPGGIFGKDMELRMFEVIDYPDPVAKKKEFCTLLTSLPENTQRLIVLMFGTFREIVANSEKTCMNSEAIGVSVAPSFFHTCVERGHKAKLEDIKKFKLASRIIKYLIDEFHKLDIFGKENYLYYSRITGRVLKVQEEWIWAFRFPPPKGLFTEHCEFFPQVDIEPMPSTSYLEPRLKPTQACSSSLTMLAECNAAEPLARLSLSLQDNKLLQGTNTSYGSSISSSPTLANSRTSNSPEDLRTDNSHVENSRSLSFLPLANESSSGSNSVHDPRPSIPGPTTMTLEELKAVNTYAENTRSLSFLPIVHEKQTARMKTRSQWFLGLPVDIKSYGGSLEVPSKHQDLSSGYGKKSTSGSIVGGLSVSAESIQKRPSMKGYRDKKMYRTSSRKNKENGSCSSSGNVHAELKATIASVTGSRNKHEVSNPQSNNIEELEIAPSTSAAEDRSAETFCVKLTYKPRI